MDQRINITMEHNGGSTDVENDGEVLYSLRVGGNKYVILGPIR